MFLWYHSLIQTNYCKVCFSSLHDLTAHMTKKSEQTALEEMKILSFTDFSFHHWQTGHHPLTSAGLSSWTGGRCHWLPPSPGGSRPQRGCGSHGNRWVCAHTSDWSPQLLEHSDCKHTFQVRPSKKYCSTYSGSVVLTRSSSKNHIFFLLSQSYDELNSVFSKHANVSIPLELGVASCTLTCSVQAAPPAPLHPVWCAPGWKEARPGGGRRWSSPGIGRCLSPQLDQKRTFHSTI